MSDLRPPMTSYVKSINPADPTAHRPLSQEEYLAFKTFLERAAGIMLGDNKHYLVTSRLGKLMAEYKFASFTQVLERLDKDIKFRERIIDAMTTNETSWFRDTQPYNILKEVILPECLNTPNKTLRIWSAACSTGQEPYSISICIQEYLASRPGHFHGEVEIVATDISPSVLQEAKDGLYEELALGRGLSAERRARFFAQKGKQWEVCKEVKSRVNFKLLNLAQNFSGLGRFDVIFCRNVLIYFSTDLKRQVLNRMAEILNPQGYLLLGGSESMANHCDAFQMVRSEKGMLYRIKQAGHK